MNDRVTPMIHVRDVQATVAWYKDIGFTVNDTYGDDNGGLSFAIVSFGSTQVMFNSGGKSSSEQRREVDLYTYTTGVDDLFERLKARVEIIEGPHETFYGKREFLIRDLNGFWITFAEDSAYGELMNAMYSGDVEAVKALLDRGSIKAEWLTNALMTATSTENKNDAIAELLRNAGATLPPQVDAETLRTYTGHYRSDMGSSVEMVVRDGQLCAVISGEGNVSLIAMEPLKFRHPFLDHINVRFKVEAGKAVGFELREGEELSEYVRVSV
jgi:uncharacterized glyoxalase superfamily protein PhnB